MKLYALHDKKASVLSSFYVDRSDAHASRSFADAVNGKDSVLGKYPEDFELVSVCDVHDAYGPEGFAGFECIGSVEHRVVVTAAQVLALRPVDGQLSLLR